MEIPRGRKYNVKTCGKSIFRMAYRKSFFFCRNDPN